MRRTPRPFAAVRDVDRDRWVGPGAPGYWSLLWDRYRSVGFRLLFALGVWEVREGDYYRNGHLTWENSASRAHPAWPRDGREFWEAVL